MTEPAKTGVLIVDDEAPARSILKEFISEQNGVRILAECANGFEAVKAAGELQPDVVFLDIDMPKLDGFEVAQLIDPAIAVVFVTAYDQYALRAFEVHAVDYVLKPFRRERLEEALRRARERAGHTAAPDPAALPPLPSLPPAPAHPSSHPDPNHCSSATADRQPKAPPRSHAHLYSHPPSPRSNPPTPWPARAA